MRRYTSLYESDAYLNMKFSNRESSESLNEFLVALLKQSYDKMVQKTYESFLADVEIVLERKKDPNRKKETYYDSLSIGYSMVFDPKGNLKPNYKDNLLKEAHTRAKQMQQSYLIRLHAKLDVLFAQKKITNIELLDLRISVFYDALMRFVFEDGSSFVLNSQIVYKQMYNRNYRSATEFFQFPMIFQKVVMTDGTTYAKQSYDWMLEHFVKLDMADYFRNKEAEKQKQQQIKKLDKKRITIYQNYFSLFSFEETYISLNNYPKSFCKNIEFKNIQLNALEKLVQQKFDIENKIKQAEEEVDAKDLKWGSDEYYAVRKPIVTLKEKLDSIEIQIAEFTKGLTVILTYKDGTVIKGISQGFDPKHYRYHKIGAYKKSETWKANYPKELPLKDLSVKNIEILNKGDVYLHPENYK